MIRLTALCMLLASAGVASAQTVEILADLTSGDPVTGDFPPDLDGGETLPMTWDFYTITAEAGDLVRIEVNRLTDSLDPASAAYFGDVEGQTLPPDGTFFDEADLFLPMIFVGAGDDEDPPATGAGPFGDPNYSFVASDAGTYTIIVVSYSSDPGILEYEVMATIGDAPTAKLEYIGDTSFGDRFNRPDSLSSLSTFATDVAFEATEIEVTEDGAYTFLSDQTDFGFLWDGYLLVYENAFDPFDPLTNLIAFNDDYFGVLLPGTGVGYSGIEDLALTSGVPYIIVQTGYDNPEEGPYQIQVLGNGDVRLFSCYADLDGDGQLTIFDFLAYQNLFDAGDPDADCDEDGSLTIFDFLCYQNAFDAGCE
ncbi:MAG: GC-type dockerin domain-anchored protein [Phycisphaerales bacterium JB064]